MLISNCQAARISWFDSVVIRVAGWVNVRYRYYLIHDLKLSDSSLIIAEAHINVGYKGVHEYITRTCFPDVMREG